MGERKGHPVVTRGFTSSAWCSLFTELFPPPFVFLGFVRLALLTVFNERTKIKREIELHCTWPQSCTRRVTGTCPW